MARRKLARTSIRFTLTGNNVTIEYQVEQGRRFRLSDIRITGTNRLSFEDVEADLKSQKANAIGLIPFLGYGRGYTSLTLLEQDRRTVEAYMRDLGYRKASAQVLQGVSINGDNLIITFQVDEGPLTRIAGVEVKGNKIYTDERASTGVAHRNRRAVFAFTGAH